MSAVLAIDTSSPVLGVCVVKDGRAASLGDGSGQETHHEELLLVTERCFSEANVSSSDISAVLVSSGPGSFTGLRIGLSFAKGFSHASKLRLVLVETFPSYAWSARSSGDSIWVIGDARRKECFFAAYAVRPDFHELEAPRIISLPELEARFRNARPAAIVCQSAAFAGLVRAEVPAIEPLVVQPRQVPEAMVELWRRPLSPGQAAYFEEFDGSDAAALSAAAPRYIREAAAKTIAERAKAS